MASLLSTTGLARISSRHPWRTIGFWVLLIVFAGLVTGALSDRLTPGFKLTNNPNAQRAQTLLEDRLRGEQLGSETVVVLSKTATVDDPAFRAVVEQTTADLLAAPDLVREATNQDPLTLTQREGLSSPLGRGRLPCGTHGSPGEEVKRCRNGA